MARVAEDEEREERIEMEIVVDAYDEIERSLGWYYYLKDNMTFPFKAKCISKIKRSPLRLDQTVTVVGMPTEEDCEDGMFVDIKWEDDVLSVPLEQLQPIRVDEETKTAIEDWHYWVDRGYQF